MGRQTAPGHRGLLGINRNVTENFWENRFDFFHPPNPPLFFPGTTICPILIPVLNIGDHGIIL